MALELSCRRGVHVYWKLKSRKPEGGFLQRAVKFASAVYATANPSVRMSVCPSHPGILCQNEGTQWDVVFTVG